MISCTSTLAKVHTRLHKIQGRVYNAFSGGAPLEARYLFLKHVDSAMFKEHEIRSLHSLPADYKRSVSDYGYPMGDVKSTYLKELLICEYKDTISLKDRTETNKSEWVYDFRRGRDYIAAAL